MTIVLTNEYLHTNLSANGGQSHLSDFISKR